MPRRVLVVDDDAVIRESLSEVLADEGWDVLTAGDGRVALDRMRDEPRPDVVILDLMMPIMDGWEVLEHVARDPAIATTPIVVLSASATAFSGARPEGNVRMKLPKPFDLGMLLDVVDQLAPPSSRPTPAPES